MKKHVKLIIFYGLFVVVFLEVALRLLGYFPPFIPSRYPIGAKVSETPMGLIPNLAMPAQDYEAVKGARVSLPPLKTNQLGQRDDDYALKKGSNEYRILCLGDSYTFGWGVQRGKTWPDQLEAVLQGRTDKFVNVINAGRPGRDARGNLNYLSTEGLSLNPDMVIYMILATDVGREMKHQAALRGEKWALESDARNTYGKPIVIPSNAAFSDKVKLYLRKYSAIYYSLRKYAKEGNIRRIPTIKDSDRENLAKYIEPDKAMLEGWDIQSGLIEQMKRACSDDTTFIVAIVPHPLMIRQKAYSKKMSHRYFFDRLTAKNLNTLDFVETLVAAVDSNPELMDKLFLPDDHPSALYYNIFVDELLSFIARFDAGQNQNGRDR